jgi:hypothetical protein
MQGWTLETAEVVQRLGSDLNTAGSEMRDYFVPRRSAASAVAFRRCVLFVVVQRDRRRCTVFMSAAYRTTWGFRFGPVE